ncbi:AAA family ATPase [Spirosoma harenae]
MKIHIFGASGSGVTTLGTRLSVQTGFAYLDTDSFYWEPSNPPFTVRRAIDERHKMIVNEFVTYTDCIVGGSLLNWGMDWLHQFDLAVFLWVPPKIRLNRLRKREFDRYGDIIFTNNDRNTHYEEFIDWASGYDDGSASGRTLQAHESWMQQLTCPLIEIRGEHSVDERLAIILNQLAIQQS